MTIKETFTITNLLTEVGVYLSRKGASPIGTVTKKRLIGAINILEADMLANGPGARPKVKHCGDAADFV